MRDTLQRIDDCIARLAGPFPNPAVAKDALRASRDLLEELIDRLEQQDERLMNLEELADEKTD